MQTKKTFYNKNVVRAWNKLRRAAICIITNAFLPIKKQLIVGIHLWHFEIEHVAVRAPVNGFFMLAVTDVAFHAGAPVRGIVGIFRLYRCSLFYQIGSVAAVTGKTAFRGNKSFNSL